MPLPQLSGGAAIEINSFQAGVRSEKAPKIIENRFTDSHIQRSPAYAPLEHIPKADPLIQKKLQTAPVTEVFYFRKQTGHDRPKMITGMGIILTRFQGEFSGKRPEDKNADMIVQNRIQTVQFFHGRPVL